MFTDPLEHLSAELQRLDLLLHREILCLRATYALSLDEFRGLYISDEQVDHYINQALGQTQETPAVQELTERAETLRVANAARITAALPWHRLMTAFELSRVERDILLLALAPEIDLKYESLYAYLNNDVTRKWPTCDLALRLFARSRAQRMSLRKYLLPQAPLFRHSLLQPIQHAPERPSWLAGGFCITASLPHFLLGHACQSPALAPFVEYRLPATVWETVPVSARLRSELQRLVSLYQPRRADRPPPVLIFEGRDGAGSGQAAEALCHALGVPLLSVDLQAVRASPELLPKIVQELALQQRLLGTGVYLDHGEALFDREGYPLPEASRILGPVMQGTAPLCLACPPGMPWRELFRDHPCLDFHFADPDYPLRLQLWEAHLAQAGSTVVRPTLEAVADRFILTPGQIKETVASALDRHRVQGDSTDSLHFQTLAEAARAQSSQHLEQLAVKVTTQLGWEDLVLPPSTLKRVQDVAAAIQYRHIVYSQWGFERRIASGKGLKVLFAGASGTGKTMTAGVIARDLGLDLYKIDLSGVVSKYIGETEKNLERIFHAAHSSNAILFFDEADALFGKRSEVKDAHDRYANIEVAYLLQRMEEHEGVVILASNLSKNIDEAFSRRMHYVVEFPLPDEHHREKLWRGMFPPEVPLGKDVDCQFLARQFSISGGDIKNVALDAAFLAAHDGQQITMKQLIKAMARQMLKQGRIPSPADFKHYHSLIAEGE
jgi:ATPase family associated with various cellular activities (AAA)